MSTKGASEQEIVLDRAIIYSAEGIVTAASMTYRIEYLIMAILFARLVINRYSDNVHSFQIHLYLYRQNAYYRNYCKYLYYSYSIEIY